MHPVPVWMLAGVFATLLLLTWVTFAATYVDLGALNLWIAWIQLIRAQVTPYTPNLFAFSLYILTILHSLHVIGGLVPLTSLALRARKHATAESLSNSINYTATYWHFLAVV